MSHQQTSPFMVAQDLSAVSTLSMGVAVPILSAFGQPLAILPTSLLSTQTEEFGTPAKIELSDFLPRALQHWQEQQIQLSGALTGYLGSNRIIDQLTEVITQHPRNLIVVDPVMGDQGSLYPQLPSDYPEHMRKFIRAADVIVPNLTEAQFLTGLSTNQINTVDQILPLLKALQKLLKPQAHAVITGIALSNQVGCAWINDYGQVQFVGRPILSGHFYGSGDVFASLLTGYLLNEEPLPQAIRLATSGTFIALQETSQSDIPRKFGIRLTKLINDIASYTSRD